MKLPEMNSNIFMVNLSGLHNVMAFVQESGTQQFSVRPEADGTLMLSIPVHQGLEDYAPGLLHGARARAKDKDKPKPPTGGGDNTPPGGGTPGTPVLGHYTYTEAKAA